MVGWCLIIVYTSPFVATRSCLDSYSSVCFYLNFNCCNSAVVAAITASTESVSGMLIVGAGACIIAVAVVCSGQLSWPSTFTMRLTAEMT